MTISIVVRLEKEHIDKANQEPRGNCPWDIAIAESLNIDPNFVSTLPRTIEIYQLRSMQEVLRTRTPEYIVQSIEAFDQSKPMSEQSAILVFEVLPCRQY